MFTSVLENANGMTISQNLLCMAVAMVLGVLISIVYQVVSDKYSKNFLVTLALLPILVQVVIILVNGNLGTSVAILGAFSLVRFRSVPGSSKEIACVFFAMGVGLATGMGFLTYAVCFTVITALFFILLTKTRFGEKRSDEQQLKISIPEDLDYAEIFADIFEKYLLKNRLDKVRTTNMGSMYELTYNVQMKDEKQQKAMIDELRCRNGNLQIVMGRPVTSELEL